METTLKSQALVMKVASRCNLNCTYCYMYNLGDTTYRTQPRFMSEAVAEALLQKVRNHCRKHGLVRFEFIFHGGEPLLMPPGFYRWFVARARDVLLPGTRPAFSLQTNGTLLTEEWCRLLGELNISVGISLDGPPGVNDRSRVDHQGKGTYASIARGLRSAQGSGALRRPPGVLCVIDVSADPLLVYGHLRELRIGNINFLLPYATRDAPPPGWEPGGKTAPYADWLIAVFDRWYQEEAPKPRVKLFEQIIELILGIDRGAENLGSRNPEFLVIETNGDIEPAGALKVCGNGFTKAGMNVLRNELDEALTTELARMYHLSHRLLPRQCGQCPIVQVCGGGFLPHRYSRRNGFENASVFCTDLAKLITHIQNVLVRNLPPELTAEAAWHPISFREVQAALQNP